MKNKKNKNSVYMFGGNINPGAIENPSTALADNQIMLAKAQQESANNPWTQGLDMFGNLAMQVGTSMMQKGAAGGQGVSKGGFDWGSLLGKGVGALGAYGNQQTNSFAMGGMTGGNPQMIEAEGGEVVETPNGEMQELQGPNHEQGGIDLNLPEGTEIFSKRLKGPDGKTMADRKISRENKLTKAEKLYKKNPSDTTLKKTVERITAANEKEEGLDVAEMEQARQAYNMGAMMLTGGKMKYAPGGVVGSPPFDLSFLNDLVPNFSGNTSDYGFQHGETNSPMLGDMTQDANDAMLQNDVDSFSDLDQIVGNVPDSQNIDTFMDNSNAKADKRLMKDINGDGKINFKETAAGKIMGNVGDYFGDLFGAQEGGKNGNAEKGMNFTLGDGLGIAGNYLAMTDPMKNTLANRASDTPNINPFKDYGKEGMKTLEDSKRFADTQRGQAMQDLELSKTAARNRSRGMSRGLNSSRAGDLATELGAMKAQGNINSNYMSQLLGIDSQMANAQNQQDQVVMGGEGARDMNDRKDKDNFYSQLGIDKATRAEGMMNMGSIANKIKERGTTGNALDQLYENFKVNGMSGDVAYKAAEMAIQDPTFFGSLKDNPNVESIFKGLQDGSITKDEKGQIFNAQGQQLDLQTLQPVV